MICFILIVKTSIFNCFWTFIVHFHSFLLFASWFFPILVTGMLCGWTVANVTNFTITKGL